MKQPLFPSTIATQLHFAYFLAVKAVVRKFGKSDGQTGFWCVDKAVLAQGGGAGGKGCGLDKAKLRGYALPHSRACVLRQQAGPRKVVQQHYLRLLSCVLASHVLCNSGPPQHSGIQNEECVPATFQTTHKATHRGGGHGSRSWHINMHTGTKTTEGCVHTTHCSTTPTATAGLGRIRSELRIFCKIAASGFPARALASGGVAKLERDVLVTGSLRWNRCSHQGCPHTQTLQDKPSPLTACLSIHSLNRNGRGAGETNGFLHQIRREVWKGHGVRV